ncbi:hypothetical protein [Saccharothrix variisporea]|nr:hypothetical protein [Saccharothrix variisporea]
MEFAVDPALVVADPLNLAQGGEAPFPHATGRVPEEGDFLAEVVASL